MSLTQSFQRKDLLKFVSLCRCHVPWCNYDFQSWENGALLWSKVDDKSFNFEYHYYFPFSTCGSQLMLFIKSCSSPLDQAILYAHCCYLK